MVCDRLSKLAGGFAVMMLALAASALWVLILNEEARIAMAAAPENITKFLVLLVSSAFALQRLLARKPNLSASGRAR